jgi:hypothetical protein
MNRPQMAMRYDTQNKRLISKAEKAIQLLEVVRF